MLGDFINRCLILLLGYAYPGFECYKTVEKNRVDIEELRFWCKYWIIVALFTVLEKFADIFLAWIPMYGETKLVLFVYMWYPKTKGTGYIYETVLRPYVSRHENEIDRKLLEWKARGWDYVIFYWQYCAQFGHSAFLTALQQLASQSTKIIPTPTIQPQAQKNVDDAAQVQQTAPEISLKQASFQMKQTSSVSKSKKWPPSPPSSPHRSSAAAAETPKSQTVQQHVPLHDSTSEYSQEEEEEDVLMDPETITMAEEGKDGQRVSVRDRINRARARLRRLDKQTPGTPRTPSRRQQ